MSERICQGRPAAPGIVAGTIVRDDAPVIDSAIDGYGFEAARTKAIESLTELLEDADDEAAGILGFQLALLDDEEFLRPIREAEGEAAGIVAAVEATFRPVIEDYRASDDPLFQTRAQDLVDLRDRLLGRVRQAIDPKGAILIGADLTPSRFLELYRQGLAGAALGAGGPTSHVSILARSRGFPMVCELGDLADVPAEGTVVVDGTLGQLVLAPDATRIGAIQAARQAAKAPPKTGPVHDAAGHRVLLQVNFEDLDMLGEIDPARTDGIGLFRTEFLFSEGPPDEEAQYKVYRRLLRWAKGRPVTVRTLDAGGDKPIPGLTVPHENNPFLGVRGIRLSFANPKVFKIQLRALARAAADGPLEVMVPMVTRPEELATVKAMLAAEVEALLAEGRQARMPALGMMVEVPAAALRAAEFDTHFYSIGTNDLVQYTMAAARDDAGVADLLDTRDPAVLRLIREVADAGRVASRKVAVCGDAASDPGLTGVLLDAGVNVLSVTPAALDLVRAAIEAHGGPAA